VTSESRKLFLSERTRGIGGSSAAALLADTIETQYACKRELYYRHSGAKPDFPDEENEAMRLGTIGEAYVARAYERQTGRRMEKEGLRKHSVHESMQVHADPIVYPGFESSRQGRGVSEIKVVGRQMIRKVKEEGLPVEYLCQIFHGIACYEDVDWGVFILACREDIVPLIAIEQEARLNGEEPPAMREPKLHWFEVERKDGQTIIEALEKEAPRFWASLKDPEQIPARLASESSQCQRCAFRVSCQGSALRQSVDEEDDPKHPPLREEFSPLVDELRARHAATVAAEELEQETLEVIKIMMARESAISVMVPDENGEMKRRNIIYRIRDGARRLKADRIVPQYVQLRKAAIEAGVPGAELAPPIGEMYDIGALSRPLLTAAVLPKKKKAEVVPEQDAVEV
jgi:CRISPR/Cas system-associated exonuclease Cas4 (RecB family)